MIWDRREIQVSRVGFTLMVLVGFEGGSPVPKTLSFQ